MINSLSLNLGRIPRAASSVVPAIYLNCMASIVIEKFEGQNVENLFGVLSLALCILIKLKVELEVVSRLDVTNGSSTVAFRNSG